MESWKRDLWLGMSGMRVEFSDVSYRKLAFCLECLAIVKTLSWVCPTSSTARRALCELRWFLGGPGQSPTADLRVRSALLYATELPGHVKLVYLDRFTICSNRRRGCESYAG